MTQSTEQERAEFPSPALLKKLQTRTEGGAILCDDYAGGYDLLTEIWRVIVADEAARRAPVVPVPQGWKLVPEEASSDMVNAGEDAFCGTYNYAMIPDVYAAMLAAAPQASGAAPMQLPEPAAVVVAIDRKVFADGVLRVSSASISFCDLEKVDLGSNLYTEQQVRELLAAHGNGGDKT